MSDDYPHDLTVGPLTSWPGRRNPSPIRSQFSASMSNTREILTRELWALGSRSPVLEVDMEANQFRIDGRPRATAKAVTPAVVLSLPTTKVGALRYPADRYDRWQDNLRAIALTMEALRKVDRYGCTPRNEQYAGFKALPGGEPRGPMTERDARQYLAKAAEWPVEPVSPRDVELAYRQAAKLLHPDAGGSTAEFQRLQEAMRALRGETR